MKRLGIISLLTLLFAAFIWVWNYSYQSGLEEAYIGIDAEENQGENIMPAETGVFERSNKAIDYLNMPTDEVHQRSLNNYYKNRAFQGAPPSIPHEVNERNMGGKSCLKCHENGGFVPKYEAYAPVTPHPEMVNCRQCHVPEHTNELFVATTFQRGTTPEAGINNALEGSPPTIPHDIHMRENCLACHGGPAAPKEIRVTHPERVNCRQCHALNNSVEQDLGIFKRKINE